MNSKSAAITVIVLIILVVIAFLAFGHRSASAPASTATTTDMSGMDMGTSSSATATTTSSSASHGPVTITYGPNGFSPKSITVPVGTTVTWVNQSGGPMWVAVGNHPIHTLYDGTTESQHCVNGAPISNATFDECSTGSSFTFTINKPGTWPYHNHAHASDMGSITVTP